MSFLILKKKNEKTNLKKNEKTNFIYIKENWRLGRGYPLGRGLATYGVACRPPPRAEGSRMATSRPRKATPKSHFGVAFGPPLDPFRGGRTATLSHRGGSQAAPLSKGQPPPKHQKKFFKKNKI